VGLRRVGRGSHHPEPQVADLAGVPGLPLVNMPASACFGRKSMVKICSAQATCKLQAAIVTPVGNDI